MRKTLLALGYITLLLAVIIVYGYSRNIKKHDYREDYAKVSDSSEIVLSEMKVGILVYRFSDNYMTLYRRELEKDLIEAGFKKENIVILDSSDNSLVQDRQIRSLIEEKVDALVINPVDASDVSRMTDLAVKSKIPLIYVNREPEASEENRWESNNWNVTYVGCDARQSGTLQGKLITHLGLENVDKNGDGVVQYMMLTGDIKSDDAQCRTEYCIKALEEEGWESKCVYEESADWDRTRAQELVADAIEKHPDTEVIFCNNDAMALGALTSVERSGRRAGKDVLIVGVDALTDALIAIIEGQMVGTVFNDYVQQAQSTADALIAYLHGQSNPYLISCEYVPVTQDNAHTVLENLAK